MPINIDGEFFQRDGKDYFSIKSVNSDLNISYLKLDVYKDGFFAKGWTIPTNVLLNHNLENVKDQIIKNKQKFNVIIEDILTKILDKVAVQDIYQN